MVGVKMPRVCSSSNPPATNSKTPMTPVKVRSFLMIAPPLDGENEGWFHQPIRIIWRTVARREALAQRSM
jgi:hypothetical protein